MHPFRRKDKLEEVAAACKKAGAKEVLVLAKDLSDLSCSPQIVKETINKFGSEYSIHQKYLSHLVATANLVHGAGLDVLVSNAGIVHFEKAVDTKLEDFQWIVNFNLTMPFLIAREALPHLRKVKGNIVFISSDSGKKCLVVQDSTECHLILPLLAGVRPDCGLIAYCASKGGLNQMARVMALEEAPNKVRVNLVSPGAILTDAMSSFYTGKR